MKRLALIISSLMFYLFVCSQNISRMTKIGVTLKTPMREAEVSKVDSSMYKDYLPGLFFLSSNDSVFAISNGIVTAVYYFSMREGFVTIKDSANNYYNYMHLFITLVGSGGEIVKKGDLIGIAKNDEKEKGFALYLNGNNKDGEPLSEEQILQLVNDK